MEITIQFSKWKVLVLILSLSWSGLYSQQDAQFTQFVFNKLTFNPAYAGSTLVPCLSAIHRQQWAGIDGAPVTSAFSFNTPFIQEKIGMGLTIIHDQIGPTRDWSARLAYSYRIPVEEGTLSIGLQGTVRQYRVVWNDAVLTHRGDNSVAAAESSRVLPNAGLGIYYEQQDFYAGLSMPRILENDLDLLEDLVSTDITSFENRHIFGMVGVLLDINENLKIKPATLIKYVQNAPVDMDLNVTAILKNDLWMGASYRFGGSEAEGFGESISALLQYQITDAFRIGAAYDFTLTEIRNQTSGTYEFYVSYCLKNKGRISNPRFF